MKDPRGDGSGKKEDSNELKDLTTQRIYILTLYNAFLTAGDAENLVIS